MTFDEWWHTFCPEFDYIKKSVSQMREDELRAVFASCWNSSLNEAVNKAWTAKAVKQPVSERR